MPEASFILHQYAFSPFGEKVRAMLGYVDLPWQAVEVPPQPPRPSLDPMLTGYRKSPVAQIGADIFCDTRLIGDEIARMTGRNELSIAGRNESDLEFLDRLEGPIFAACLSAMPKGKMLWKLVTSLGFGLPRFLRDRAKLGAAGGLDIVPASEAGRIWTAHLDDLEARVGSGFLGGSQPDVLDFSAYHLVWFFELMSDAVAAGGRPSLARWQREIAAFGHGRPEEMSGARAVDVARTSDPRPIARDPGNPRIGARARVSPTDYGRDETEGVLVAETADRWVLERTTDECGLIHVHFPTRGFVLTTL